MPTCERKKRFVGRLSEALGGHEMVAIDTNCFIYSLEGRLWAEEPKQEVFLPLEQGCFCAVTSVLTVAEILVRPESLGLDDVCEEYTLLLSSYPNLEIVSFTLKTALRCAEVRSRHRIRAPDALQIATALKKGAGVFLTNDAGLPPEVDGLRVILLRNLLESPAEVLVLCGTALPVSRRVPPALRGIKGSFGGFLFARE